MIHHIDLGNDPAERSRQTGALIRSGRITLAGYKKGRIYGLLRCASGKRMKAKNRVFFKDEAEAQVHGYRPCGHCLPALYKKWKAAQAPQDPGCVPLPATLILIKNKYNGNTTGT